ncbi:MAG: histidine kinase dimerization/phospho-acceptor domain-containing protein, partial [Thermodesulfobacteriota bacterium]
AFLLLVILFLGIAGSIFIYKLANDSGEIIKDNYNSIDYSLTMLKSLDQIHSFQIQLMLSRERGAQPGPLSDKPFKDALKTFDENFRLQANNITEPGERQVVESLGKEYKNYLETLGKTDIGNSSSSPEEINQKLESKYESVRELIYTIYNMNMKAILSKNARADQTADKVALYMTVTMVASFIIALVFILYFPGHITKPLRMLTENIKDISLGRYDKRLNFSSTDEIGDLVDAYNKMATSLEEYEKSNISKLLIEKKRTEAIIDNMSDAIIVLDENKNIVSANRVALHLTGIEKLDRLIGQNAQDAAQSNDLIKAMLKDVIQDKTVNEDINIEDTPIHIAYDNKLGYYNRETTSIRAVPADSNKSIPIGYLVMLKNITRFEEQNAAKTNFMATVSHEIKTPLSSINLILGLLQDKRVGDLNDEQTELVHSIRMHTGRLSRMANELLDASQIESGKIQLSVEEERPGQIINFAINALSEFLREKDINLRVEIEHNLPFCFADLEKS